MSKTETATPTCNGIIKGRPGKGRVLSLGQRKKCYANHTMTPENTFRYTAKRVKGKAKPVEREWCKKCRATSRKASAVARRMREAKEEQARQKEVKAELRQALPKARKVKAAAKPKVAKVAKVAKVKAAKAANAKAVKVAKAKVANARNSQTDAA